MGWQVDDPIHLLLDPQMRGGQMKDLWNLWTTPRNEAYTPVTLTIWFFVAKIWGMTPQVFHRLNLLVHLLCVGLVFRILTILFPKKNSSAILGALFFALHPLHVEAIAWITCLRDLVAAALGLASLLFYLRMRFGAYIALFVLAVLAKPTAICIPLLAAALGYFHHEKRLRQLGRELWPVFLVAPLFMLQNSLNSVLVPASAKALGLGARFLIALDALNFYLSKLFLPFGLGFDYGRTPAFVLSRPILFLSLLPPLFMTSLAFKQKNILTFSFFFFVLALLPCLGLVPFIFQFLSTVADRYLYLALVGPALLVAYLVQERGSRPIILAGCVLYLVFLGMKSREQLEIWRSPFTLYEHSLKVNPRSWYSHSALGDSERLHGFPDRAINHYLAAAPLMEDLERRAEHWNFLGQIFLERSELTRALASFTHATSLNPSFAWAQANLGVTWWKLGQVERAKENLLTAWRLNSELVRTHVSSAALDLLSQP